MEGSTVLSEISLSRKSLGTLQVNLGMVCNQACVHCHHNAGPGRIESMSAESCRKTLRWFEAHDIPALELTGGAPELNPNFKKLVRGARALGRRVVVRSNLTVLFEDGMEGLAHFLAEYEVDLACSLPCYREETVDRQRGKGVYRKSVEALCMLGELGYGKEGSGLSIYLVNNPAGAFLPGDQSTLEDAYRENLGALGIRFTGVFAMANMPLGRFADRLEAEGAGETYRNLLRTHADPCLLANAMCRELVSVGWDGRAYDCDFNQALGLALSNGKKLWDFTIDELFDSPITLGDHCLGCIAGSGSSCTGALGRD
ncbi:MAG: arsenosugar biosynthesis radical SAM (seleno)protein ArsS [Candidatus Aquicultorales bacterium]